MAHHAFLIAIFLVLTLVIPAVIALRVFGTVFSESRKSLDVAATTQSDATNLTRLKTG